MALRWVGDQLLIDAQASSKEHLVQQARAGLAELAGAGVPNRTDSQAPAEIRQHRLVLASSYCLPRSDAYDFHPRFQ